MFEDATPVSTGTEDASAAWVRPVAVFEGGAA